MKTEIKKYCNRHGYSDATPFEVVRVISPKCVEIRAMDYVQTVFPKEFHNGGFMCHVADNHNQAYEYTSNPENHTMKIWLSKRGWGWGQYHMNDNPIRFYDYNF